MAVDGMRSHGMKCLVCDGTMTCMIPSCGGGHVHTITPQLGLVTFTPFLEGIVGGPTT